MGPSEQGPRDELAGMGDQYLKRLSDERLELLLRSMGAVLIEGPKWCGKTRSAEEFAESSLYLQDPEGSKERMLALQVRPSSLLEGETPRLLDEWQQAPELWNAVRFEVDKRRKRGQFILTGSVSPKRTDDMHTGTGRIGRLRMRTMSLFETGDSTGQVPLSGLFDGADVDGASDISLERMAFLINRGGWPAVAREEDEAVALTVASSYLESVVNQDISAPDDVLRRPDRVRALVRSLARNVSSEARNSTILRDLEANDESLSPVTVDSYIEALRRIFVLEDLPAWSAKLRSKTAIRTAAKRHFADPSIAAAALKAAPGRLLRDLNTFGLLFESLCVHDLRVYADSLGGSVRHYRDKSGLEVDAIVQLDDGRWGAAEIKLGAGQIESAAENLLKLKGKVDEERAGEPSFLMVLTATERAFRMGNGVAVVPLGCLRN